jgi:hypothetical protein
MEQRLSLVTLGVTDIDRPPVLRGAGWSGESPTAGYFFQAADGRRAVEPTGGPTASSPTAVGGAAGPGPHWPRQAVDVVLAEAEAAGATIGRAGAATPWGGYSGLFLDPDGHPWEVAHNPYWVLAEDGSIHLH